MKELLLKIGKGILYFFGGVFILMSITTLFEGGSFIAGLLSIVFGALMLPIVYGKVKEFIFKKSPKLSKAKFIISYTIIVFLGYMISFGTLADGTATKQLEEKNKIESMTKLNVEYNINDTYTTEDSLEIKLSYENLENLEINGNKIDITENNTTYTFPLELGDNEIQIIGTNKTVTREFTKNIEKITKENLQARIEQEEKRIALEKEQAELEKQKQLEEQKKKEEIAQKQKELQEQERVKQALERLNKEIDGVNKFNGDTYKTSVDTLAIEVGLFGAYALIVEQYINDSNEEVKSLAKQLETKVSQLQIKEFPKMRKAYIDLASKKLWTSNVEVYAKGNYNGTIEFIGGTFANNQNKLDFYSTIKDMLKLLRFDRANFKWYKYDDEYTYWEIDSLADAKVVKISE